MPAETGSDNFGHNESSGEDKMKTMDALKEKFGEKIKWETRSQRRVYAEVSQHDLKDIVVYMFKILGARLSTISSVDTRAGIELLYHMMADKGTLCLSVKTMVKKPELIIESITKEIEGAEWVEREVHEMMGVNFKDHPNMKRLLLPDDWKDGDFPYRKKSFDSEKEGPK
jgi:NADH-quinone oxidoreductase subunit C